MYSKGFTKAKENQENRGATREARSVFGEEIEFRVPPEKKEALNRST